MSNFHPLEVVCRGSETQLHVSENLNNIANIARKEYGVNSCSHLHMYFIKNTNLTIMYSMLTATCEENEHYQTDAFLTEPPSNVNVEFIPNENKVKVSLTWSAPQAGNKALQPSSAGTVF